MRVWIITHDWRPWGVFSTLDDAVESANNLQGLNEGPELEFRQIQGTGSYVSEDPSIVILEMEVDFDPYQDN